MDIADASARVDALAERYWRFLCEETPYKALMAGEPVTGSQLFREGVADHDRRDAAVALLLEEAVSTPPPTDRDRALTLELLRGELEGRRRLYAVGAHLRPPLLPVGPDFAAVDFANTAAIADAASAALYVERLAMLPDLIRDIGEALQTGIGRGYRYPRVVVDAAARAAQRAAQADPAATPWAAPFRRSPAAGDESVRRQAEAATTIIRDRLLPALQAHAALLDGPLRRGARDSIACSDDLDGEAFYAACVQHHTTATLTPRRIHDIGLEEVARLAAEMEAVAAEAGFAGDLPGYRRFLADDPQFVVGTAEGLRIACESVAKRIDRQIPAFFGRIPRMTYGIETMSPALSEFMPPAYAQPNPADGSAPGIFWLTALPSRCPTWMLTPLTLHEAWPGHLLHLALLQEMTHLPAFLRHGATRYTACIEGWALYCESLGIEMGLYTTPHQHYGRLEMEMWRAQRLVLDTGIHAFGWTRDRAIESMCRHMALPRETIVGEIDRYIGLPGQALAYQLGVITIRGLRQRAERAAGDSFDRRAFHDRFLTAGPASLSALEAHLAVGD